MTDQFSIITTLVTGFGLALVFGWLAERFLKTPTLVGYIIAGVFVGLFPLLPNVDRVVTEQFAEIGVMLLMFGVGLHFSVADLVKVKGVAVTGAMLQMAASGAAGTAVALLAWDWALPNAIVFGMTLSCASTVVVMKALELHKLSVTPSGQVAIGWLVVQDLVTVFIMVCLPLVAQVTQGEGPVDPRLIVISLSKTLLGVAVFVAGMLIVGKRLFPWILQRVALSGSRELFTLCVLAIAIGIAYGAGAIFNVSYALGAFFAGMVMRESSFAHRAARNCLPLQDAFSVLFFISVGLMLDPYVFVNEPWAVIAVMLIIMCITSSVTAALVLLLGWPLDTALVMGACVSQLGEFSFILCGQGIALGIATPGTMSIVVAASILTIALNPLMFTAIPHVRKLLVSRRPFFARMAERVSPLASVEPKTIKGHVLIAGVNEVVLALLPRLEARGIDFTCFVMSDTTAAVVDSYKHGSAIVGNPSDPALLVQGHLVDAEVLVLPSSDMVLNKTVFAAARELKHDCRIIVRVAAPKTSGLCRPTNTPASSTTPRSPPKASVRPWPTSSASALRFATKRRSHEARRRTTSTRTKAPPSSRRPAPKPPRAPPGMRPETPPAVRSSTASGRRWRSTARKRRGRRPPSRPPRPLRLPRVVKPQTPRSMRPPFPRLKSPPSSPA